ncbi:MAG: phenylalanine--tRNA ligase subunit alpha [Candidatus Anstonellales archaeon]
MILHQYEKRILLALRPLNHSLSLSETAKKASLSEDAAIKAAMWLAEKGLAKINSQSSKILSYTNEGESYLKNGFPEVSVTKKARAGLSVENLDPLELKIGLPWAKKKGWIEILSGKLVLTEKGAEVLTREVTNPYIPSEQELILRGLAQASEKKTYTIELTSDGKNEAERTDLSEEEINQITRQMLISGEWRGKKLREYDISSPVEETLCGKRHIISLLQNKISKIFQEMGFEEMEGKMIESSFWNFDALFQPQDHPARDLADTFYLEGEHPLPDNDLVQRIKKVHMRGWKYKWKESEAKKTILRTHTTSVSARTLYSNFKAGIREGKKYFCIGKVFRNEATDYKHLAEFFQVEGIVVWEGATFCHLLGFLSEFYKKLGFEKIRFRPSYFPYTEPSLEVHVWYEPKKSWMELGGAGIFRPEVSLPLSERYPVLAWGLSLERPLMLLLGIEDIRSFYKNNIGFLRASRFPELLNKR